ncbi:hypothetical protein D3C71_804130 [compost metagenome]
MPWQPFQSVKLEPAKSAEPPSNSGNKGPNACNVFWLALRVAIVSPFAFVSRMNASACAANSAGKSPLIRRSNSAASVGYFA